LPAPYHTHYIGIVDQEKILIGPDLLQSFIVE